MDEVSSSTFGGDGEPRRRARSISAEANAAAQSIGIEDRKWWTWAGIVVVILSAILYFARLGVRALWSEEFRWAEIAREMILTHNYFWPTINGHVYYDKPLGSYWLVVASTYLTGGLNELAARIPCAIAGVLGVILIILLTRRLYDLKTAVLSGIILATSYSYVFFARTASADAETVAGELAALVLFLRYEENPEGWWVLWLWLIMAVTSLTKGLLGFVLPILVIGSYATLSDGWAEFGEKFLHGKIADRVRWVIDRNRWLFNWRTIIAAAISLSLYLAPFLVSHSDTGSDKGLFMVYHENIKRYFEPFDHRGPMYLYIYIIFALMAPWSALLPASLVHTHYRRHVGADRERADRFTLIFFWGIFIFFTLSGSRRSYYLLPILPAAAILVARLLTSPLESLSVWARRLLIAGFAVITAAVVLSTLAFFPPHYFLPKPYSYLPKAPYQIPFAIYWVLSVAAVIYAIRKFSSTRVVVSVAAVAYLFMFYLYIFAMPAGDAYRPEKSFAARVKQAIGNQAKELAFYRNEGPVYYLGLPKPVPEYFRLKDLDDAVENQGVKWVVIRRRDMKKINLPAQFITGETLYPWDSKRHRLDSMVLVKVSKPTAQ